MIYKRTCIALLCVMLMTNVFGQIEFEKGYVIDQNNQRVECLIKNLDWKNNPEAIKYKLNPNDNELEGTLETIKEFQVYGYSKYIVASVDIDRSPDDYSNLNTNREPVWSAEKLFLRVLVGGKASLYKYESRDFIRFFYAVDATPIRQLVHKEYQVETAVDNYTVRKVGENNLFQQQLLNEVNCGGLTASTLKLLRYTESELTKYFKKYNACHGESSSRGEDLPEEKPKAKRDVFVFKLTPGMNYTQLTASNPQNHAEYEKKFSPRLGIEGEFLFPFNKNKLSFLFEPSFQSYNADKTSGSGSVNFTSIEFPLGLRYYFFLNAKSKIFFNVHYVPGTPFVFDSTLKIRGDYELEVDAGDNLAVGAGFAAGRFTGEVRYYSGKEITRNYGYWESPMKTVSFIFGYQLFKIKSKV